MLLSRLMSFISQYLFSSGDELYELKNSMSSNVVNQQEYIRYTYIGDILSSTRLKVGIILISVAFNAIVYRILPSRCSPIIKSYIISTCHALISVGVVFHHFMRYEINFKQMNRLLGGGIFGTGDEFMFYSVCYSSGYLLYDFFLMLFNKSVRTGSALIHHIIILMSFCSGLFNQICHPCHFYLLGEELSTIPLNLKSLYRDYPRLNQFFSFVFVILFVFSRLFYGSIVCGFAFYFLPEFLRLTSSIDDIISIILVLSQAMLCLSTRVLNVYWMYLIFQKIFHFRSSKKNF